MTEQEFVEKWPRHREIAALCVLLYRQTQDQELASRVSDDVASASLSLTDQIMHDLRNALNNTNGDD